MQKQTQEKKSSVLNNRLRMDPELIAFIAATGLTIGLIYSWINSTAEGAALIARKELEAAAKAAGTAMSEYVSTATQLTMNDVHAFLKEHSHTLITSRGSIQIALLNALFQRYSMNNAMCMEKERLSQAFDYKMMTDHVNDADHAMDTQDYLAASHYYSLALDLMIKQYPTDHSESVNTLQNVLVYKLARALYYQMDYNQSLTIIATRLTEINPNTKSRELACFYALSGLMHFKQSRLALNAETEQLCLDAAKNNFEKAYLLDKRQNCLYFFVQYLKKTAVVDYIPVEADDDKLKIKYDIINNENPELLAQMMFLFGLICYQEKQWSKALAFFEYKCNEVTYLKSNEATELSIVKMNAIQAYIQLIESSAEGVVNGLKIKQYKDNETGGVIDRFVNHEIPTSDAHTNCRLYIDQVFHLLQSSLLLGDNLSTAKEHIMLGCAYRRFDLDVDFYKEILPHKKRLTELSTEQFTKAQKILQQLLVNLKNKATTMHGHVYSIFFTSVPTKAEQEIQELLTQVSNAINAKSISDEDSAMVDDKEKIETPLNQTNQAASDTPSIQTSLTQNAFNFFSNSYANIESSCTPSNALLALGGIAVITAGAAGAYHARK